MTGEYISWFPDFEAFILPNAHELRLLTENLSPTALNRSLAKHCCGQDNVFG